MKSHGLWRAVSALAAGALVTACAATPDAAPVNVEGTVQARVSATVAAATRAQGTATRSPLSTTVTGIGLTPSPSGSPSGSPSPAGSASPARTATPGGTGTPSPLGTGTPGGTVTGTRPAGTGTPSAGTPTVGSTAAATPIGPLTLGTFARFGSLGVSVARYDWGQTCASGSGRAAAGSKLVTLQLAMRNESNAPLLLPSVQWSVEGRDASSGAAAPCQPDDQQLGNACYRSGQLAAGARCEGWLVFEVPESVDVPGATVRARSTAPRDAGEATWRLPAG